MEKITKHNTFKVSQKVHDFAHNKFGCIKSVRTSFCGGCKNNLILYITITPNCIGKMSTDFKDKLTKAITKLVMGTFKLTCEIFFL